MFKLTGDQVFRNDWVITDTPLKMDYTAYRMVDWQEVTLEYKKLGHTVSSNTPTLLMTQQNLQ